MGQEAKIMQDLKTQLHDVEAGKVKPLIPTESNNITPETRCIDIDIESLRVRPTDNIPDPVTYLGAYNSDGEFISYFTEGNLSVISGKSKSGKTTILSPFIASLIVDEYDRFRGLLPADKKAVIVFDTEQGKSHVKRNAVRHCTLANITDSENLQIYALRGIDPDKCLQIIEAKIRKTPEAGFVIIDGVYDICANGYLDERESKSVVSKLMALTVECKVHIACIIHENINNNNATGWLGRLLTQKGETLISTTKDKKEKGLLHVEFSYCRGAEPEPFSVRIGANGMPEIIDSAIQEDKPARKTEPTDLPSVEIIPIINEVFSLSANYGYGELVAQMQLIYTKQKGSHIGNTKVKTLITHCKNNGWIKQREDRKYIQGNTNNTGSV